MNAVLSKFVPKDMRLEFLLSYLYDKKCKNIKAVSVIEKQIKYIDTFLKNYCFIALFFILILILIIATYFFNNDVVFSIMLFIGLHFVIYFIGIVFFFKLNHLFYDDFIDDLLFDENDYRMKNFILSSYFLYPTSNWNHAKTDLFLNMLNYLYFETDQDKRIENYFKHHVDLFNVLKKILIENIEWANKNQYKYVFNEEHILNNLIEDIVDFDSNKDNSHEGLSDNIKNKYWCILLNCI